MGNAHGAVSRFCVSRLCVSRSCVPLLPLTQINIQRQDTGQRMEDRAGSGVMQDHAGNCRGDRRGGPGFLQSTLLLPASSRSRSRPDPALADPVSCVLPLTQFNIQRQDTGHRIEDRAGSGVMQDDAGNCRSIRRAFPGLLHPPASSCIIRSRSRPDPASADPVSRSCRYAVQNPTAGHRTQHVSRSCSYAVQYLTAGHRTQDVSRSCSYAVQHPSVVTRFVSQC